MAISDAVGLDIVSRTVGYKLIKGDFRLSSPNLPQRIAILGEANIANQGTLDLDAKEITSAKEAGDLYGYGSPIHSMMRILRPNSGDGVGGIPTVIYPQIEAGGAVAAGRDITVTGAATGNATHTVIINGRSNVDGASYSFNVITGDTPTLVAAKIADVINNVLGSPVAATPLVGVATATTKWAGVTSEELDIIVDTDGASVGLAYGITSAAVGIGVTDIQLALDQFGNEWNTIVINPYGEAKHSTLEVFNGIPDPINPTGRYSGIVFKPFVALWGSTEDDKDVLAAITDAKKDQVTNVLCPAPKSTGFTYEAAANGGLIFAPIMQNTPHLDASGQSYADMPVPSDGDIGDMSDFLNRNFLVKKGSSTVDFKNERYEIQDFVTTYHPDGEIPPQFRYARNLMIDFNVRFGYFLLEEINVVDHAVVENDEPVTAENVVRPKQWVQILNAYADDLSIRALTVDKAFMKKSIQVATGTANPDRFETSFSYKRSPYVRIASTTAKAGFAFGLQ